MKRVSDTELIFSPEQGYEPDYYMEDFTTITIGDTGLPLNSLYAIYMEHNPLDDSLQLDQPRLEVFREDNDPLYITADKGRATNNNEIIDLQGRVRMWELDSDGNVRINVITSDVRVLVLEEYAETDQNATITGKRTTITGRGVRADFKDNKLEILDHEKTVITQADSI
jgi:lipopolysaccharide export system protein LptC